MSKIQTLSDSVLCQSGPLSSETFGIAHSSHMFQVLSAGLYSDKISAVLREVGCNAYDAHIASGLEDLPIELHLPTAQKPFCYIKDFGPGLDDVEISNIYTVYGISTKGECLSQTGGFGLGSKAPFAYTLQDSLNPKGFTITSVKNGIKRTFVAHLNSEGIPTVTLLGTYPADSDWPHGVSVQFEVNPKDIPEFSIKAERIFAWFPIAPKVVNGTLNSTARVTASLTLPSASIYDVDLTSQYHRCSILMNNVVYPLDISRISSAINESESNEIHSEYEPILNNLLWPITPRIVSVPNNLVAITPSREGLQYTPETITTLVRHYHQIAREIFQKLQNEVRSISSILEMDSPYFERAMKSWPYLENLVQWVESLKLGGLRSNTSSLDFNRFAILLNPIVSSCSLLSYKPVLRGNVPLPTNMGMPASLVDGCSAWLYLLDKPTISKKRIVKGSLANESYVSDAVISPHTVIIYDEPNVSHKAQRLKSFAKKLHLQISKDSSANYNLSKNYMFFIGNPSSKEASPDSAKLLVESWISSNDSMLSGVRTLGISELEYYKEVQEDKPLRGLADLPNPERAPYVQVQVYDLKSKTISSKLIHELEECDKFFAWGRSPAQTISEFNEHGRAFQLKGESLLNFKAMAQFLTENSRLHIRSVVLLPTSGYRYAPELLSAGFKPFISTILSESVTYAVELKQKNATRFSADLRYYTNHSGVPDLLLPCFYLIDSNPRFSELKAHLLKSPTFQELVEFFDFYNNGMNTAFQLSGGKIYSSKSISHFLEVVEQEVPEIAPFIESSATRINRAWLAKYPIFRLMSSQPLMSWLKFSEQVTDSTSLKDTASFSREKEEILRAIKELFQIADESRSNDSPSFLNLSLYSPTASEILDEIHRQVSA